MKRKSPYSFEAYTLADGGEIVVYNFNEGSNEKEYMVPFMGQDDIGIRNSASRNNLAGTPAKVRITVELLP